MSDELLDRAEREATYYDKKANAWTTGVLIRDLAARVRELEAELEQWKTWGIVEIAARNPSVMEYIKHWEGRAERAEAERDAQHAEIERLRALLVRAHPCVKHLALIHAKHGAATLIADIDAALAGGKE